MGDGNDNQAARDGDVRGLIELQARAIPVGYPPEVRDTLAGDPSICANDLWQRWSANNRFIVAESDRWIKGFAILAEQDDDVELHGLFVHPAFWRQRVGSSLVVAAAQAAADMGGRRMVVKANPLAIKFYEVNGFILIDVVEMGGMKVPVMARQTP